MCLLRRVIAIFAGAIIIPPGIIIYHAAKFSNTYLNQEGANTKD